MRLVFPVLLIVLGVVLIGFLITNPGERVDVTLGNTQYHDTPLSMVAFFALTVGVAFTAIVALIEGATIRLDNRRLRREIQRLETENDYLRAQPRNDGPGKEGSPPTDAGLSPLATRGPNRASPASAPVYEPDGL